MSANFNTNTRSSIDVSLRLKQHNVKKAREETKKLETESRKMEDRLKELRLAMSREKEDRERHGGGYWSRGQTGNLNNYATDVLNKPATKSSSGKKRVKVLKDTPLDIPERPSQPGTMAHIAKQDVSPSPRHQKIKGPKCGQCEEKKAAVSCVQCSEMYCPACFASFHLRGALKKHRSIPISASGPRQCMSPRPTPPASNREVNYDHSLAESGGTSHQHFYNGRRDHDRNSPEGASGSFDGPSLLDGNYNEADSAASFQAALQAWRSGGTEGQPGQTPSQGSVRSVHTPRVISIETPRSSRGIDSGTETQAPPPVEIKFHSNLSYAERLLLKKHRRTDVDEMDTPRVSLPPTPRLPNPAYSPRDRYQGVEMPVTPRDAVTPRIESYPKKEQTIHDQDFDDVERVNFQSLYEAVKESDPNIKSARRDEDNISIIELDNAVKPSASVEETSQCFVEEAGEREAWTLGTQRETPTQKTPDYTAGRPPVMSGQRRTRPDDDYLSEASEQLHHGRDDGKSSASYTKSRQESAKSRPQSIKSRPPSAKSRPQTAKSRPSSAANRPKSRVMSSRPGSRSQSRAASRLDGEGLLTKKPSEALHMVAQMSAECTEQRSVPLEELFMIGVTPEPVERTMTPSKLKQSKEEKFKVSNKLYQMAPRSWRPDSSLADNVPEDNVQIEPVKDPLESLRTDIDVSVPVDLPSAELMPERVDSFTEEDLRLETPTPRASSRSNSRIDVVSSRSNSTIQPVSSRSNSTIQPVSSRSNSTIQPVSSRGNSRTDAVSKTLPSSARSRRHLPTTPRPSSSQEGSVSPHPPEHPKSVSPGQRSRSNLSRPASHMSQHSVQSMSEQSSSTARTMTPRNQSAMGDRPASRAIVMDGEDLSNYDTMGEQEVRNQDDEDTLDKLEWELASESGRITADGKISRLSAVPDSDEEGSTSSSRSFSRMSQQDQGYDINSRLRDDELGSEEEEDHDEDDVKALH